jgi:DNA-directed RNA polymerase subunit RPC12/RpoP
MRDEGMSDERHLYYQYVCLDCGWKGSSGELIAADKLRCPNCRSADCRAMAKKLRGREVGLFLPGMRVTVVRAAAADHEGDGTVIVPNEAMMRERPGENDVPVRWASGVEGWVEAKWLKHL